MRFTIIFCALIGTCLAANACSTVGPLCKKFLTTLLGKLTTKFTATDNIVCTIGNDVGNCAAEGKEFGECADVLSTKSDSYMKQVAIEKAAMFGDLLSFQGCLNDNKDLAMFDFLKKTLLVPLNNTLCKPYKSKIKTKMVQMINAGKSVAERIEQACKLGTAMTTPDLISQVVKGDMARTAEATWQNCVMGNVVKKGILTIGKFVKPAFKTKAKAPSG